MADNSFKISKGLTLKGQAAAPANPVNGDMYYDTTLQQFRVYQNGAWQGLSGTSTYARIFLNQ
jgi:hypothetical protein